MKITKDTLHKIAHLSRLELKPENEEQMLKDLNQILEWMELLNEVDTSEEEAFFSMSDVVNNFREDEVKDTLDKAEALKLAPDADEDYFKVPKVLE